MNNIILNDDQIRKKLRRIAFEIYEQNYDEKELCLIGIRENGYELAGILNDYLLEISDLKVNVCGLSLNKSQPLSEPIRVDCELKQLQNKVVIIIDDVAHSGKTLMYALKPIIDNHPKKIQIAVLVDRKHKRYPVTADFVGLLLSTGAHEMVHVKMGEELSAFVK